MSDDLVVTLLREIHLDFGEVKFDIREVKERLEMFVSGYSSISRRLDQLGGNMETVRRRFDVAEAR